MNRPTKPTDYSQLMVEILLWFVFAVVGSFVWMVNVRSKVPASWSIFHRCARVICLYHSMPTVSTITNTTVRVHTLCLKKNRTPITFWNNSNKLCLIIIMISWENRQKVLNIVVCYGLTIFHKTGCQLRLAALVGGLVWPTADRCRWRNRRMEKTSPGLRSSKGTALWTSAVISDYDVANQQFVQLQTLAL